MIKKTAKNIKLSFQPNHFSMFAPITGAIIGDSIMIGEI